MAILDDILTQLTSQSVVGGATGWEGYLGYMPPSPDKVLAIYEVPGEPPDSDEGTQYEYPSVQIIGRSDQYGYETLRTKMEEAFDSLHDVSISGFVYVFASQSGPTPLGLDENQRHRLAWEFDTMREQ